jgi:hypothetical protein
MLRAVVLSLLVLVSVAATLPLVDSEAHNFGGSGVSRRNHMGRRHSRAWWRRYRARLRRQHAALKRKRALQAMMRGETMNTPVASHNNVATPFMLPSSQLDMRIPAAVSSLPGGWSRRVASNGESKFVVSAGDGQFVGAATLSVVKAQATGETNVTARPKLRSLGGVLFADLRRSVIDKMVSANGWVVNDFQREIGGKPVFIVLAQTAASSDGRTPQLSWAFYFMEVDGRIYSLATSSLLGASDRLADDSAQFMASFRANSRAISVGTSQR